MESLGEAKQVVNPLWGTPRKTAANGEDITVAYLRRFQNELKYSKRGHACQYAVPSFVHFLPFGMQMKLEFTA